MTLANLTILREQNNYGQRLQNFALQTYIRETFGVKIVTVDNRCIDYNDVRFFHQFEKGMDFLDVKDAPNDVLSEFDHIVVGGDQVLNRNIKHNYSDIYRRILDIRNPRRNVFFYAAGIGYDRKLDVSMVNKLSPYVAAYGLREPSTNFRDFTVNIDPVFLIRDKWRDIMWNDAGVEELGYSLTYNVHKGCASKLSLVFQDGKELSYDTGDIPTDPRLFVGLFSKAAKVFTNSFHGICFSIMFNVPEIVVSNPKDSRFVQLKELLGIIQDGYRVVNYEEINRRISEEVRKSHDFMEMCLSPHGRISMLAYAKDKLVRMSSGSGGCARLAADATYSLGGVVYGGAFSEDFRVVVCKRTISDDEYMALLVKSKYSFCPLPDMNELVTDLDSGRNVLVFASPCHVHAIRTLLGRDYPNLTFASFRCVGYSRPSKLSRIVDKAESISGRKVVGIDFRPNHMTKLIVSLEGSRKMFFSKKTTFDFIFDVIPMCRKCRYAHGRLPCADIVFGDAWCNENDKLRLGAEFTPVKGCNLVEVYTEKGKRLFDIISSGVNAVSVAGHNP